MYAIRAAVLILTLALSGIGAMAQPTGLGLLVVDQEALFSKSLLGKRILAEIDQATDDLVAENTEIEAQLIAEERELTELRPTLPAAEFRQLADEFDRRVQRIRAEQDAKSEAIGASLEDARRGYYQRIVPILASIMREERAAAILDKRNVLISINLIDVTDRAIARIDASLGDGQANPSVQSTEEQNPAPAPEPEQVPAEDQ